ncbi:DNA-damage-inducible protein F [bacterium BMS3Bbin02]|nr:DNA-damage-inducible protein F [bacterium BMS3Bbin02]
MRPWRRTEFDTAIGRIAWPALGALAADPLISIVDTAFVGRIGTPELAALGVAAAVFLFAFALFNFLAYGTTPLIAGALGQGNDDEAAKFAGQAIGVAIGLGVIGMVLLRGFATEIVDLVGGGGDTVVLATRYVTIRALALPAMLVITAGHGIFRGHGDTRTPLWITIVFNVVNVVLDPLLIFGAGWGLGGAAVATVIAQYVGAVLFLVWLLRPVDTVPLVSFTRPSFETTGVFLHVGGAIVVRTTSLLIAFTVATSVAARLSSVAVAGHQVVGQIWFFLGFAIDALAIAAQTLVARVRVELGLEAVRRLTFRLLWMGLVVGGVFSVLLIALRPWIARWFTQSEAVLAEVDSVYPILIWLVPLGALVFVWDGIAIGFTSLRFIAGAMAVAMVIAVAVLMLVEPRGWGLPGVWWGIAALVVVRAVTFVVWHAVGPLRGRD